MEPGSIIDERFEVLNLAATGGMGAVFRARDRSTGATVALKVVLAGRATESHERFEREAKLMADLSHPAIVRYVAQGTLDDGSLYLVMEWLEGEDLAARLLGVGLLPREAVTIAIRVAEALAAAHARGIVHRDIKPSNVFLEGRDAARVKVLDFGIATLARAERALTRTGTTIGTPGYMAPEQARGGGKLDGRVDLFSLGCVLFEGLTGSPPFAGDHPVAVLAKVLVEEPPRVRDLMPQLPEPLDALVAWLLQKDPTKRPHDAMQAAQALADVLPLLAELAPGPTSARKPALTKSEHRIVSVVLAKGALSASLPRGEPFASAATVPASTSTQRIDAISRATAPFGGRLETLADGSILLTLLGRGAVTDQVARAARAALALKGILPETPVVLATGRSALEGRAPSSEAIDRASSLAEKGAGHYVKVDEITARLLDRRFELGERDGVTELHAERLEDKTSLSSGTPYVGRDRELTSLEALFDECVAEPSARAVVVIAAAGVGKSRLRRELASRLSARHIDLAVWTARGDPMSAGASLGMLSQIVLEACSVPPDAELMQRQQLIAQRVDQLMAGPDAERVTTFLAEIADASFTEQRGIELVAARSDPMLMGDQTRRAFEDLLEAETRTRPVLLCLDDLHWGDQASVKYIDHVLRQLHDRPLIVLAAARPEIELEFPGLFAERDVEIVRLGELPKRAAETLVRSMLGVDAADDVVGRVVERAAGNALYLEELVRAVIEGKGDSLPETVLAMVEARLGGLEGDARLVLRAASVFGRVFWRAGVEALLAGFDAAPWLELLCQREICLRRRTARFAGEDEYTFRHALFREAAYAMLTPKDRAAGHGLAAEWLEAHGEREPVVLGEHFERGECLELSRVWYARAATQALEGSDLAGAIALGEKAATGATGEARAAILMTVAEARGWRGEYARMFDAAKEALGLAATGTPLWFAALSAFAQGAARSGNELATHESEALLLLHRPTFGSVKAYASAVAASVTHLLRLARRPQADALLAALESLDPKLLSDEPLAVPFALTARSWCAMFDGDLETCLKLDRELSQRLEELGDARNAAREKLSVGYDLMVLGAFEQAEVAMRDALERSLRLGLAPVIAGAKHNLGLILLRLGRLEDAERVEREALTDTHAEAYSVQVGNAHMYLSLILREQGRLDEARAACSSALDHFGGSPAMRAWPTAELARFHLLEGDASAGLAKATEAKELLEREQPEEGEAQILLLFAEALHASGRTGEAATAIAVANERLLARAGRIRDPGLRASYLERIPDHARTLKRHAEWAG